MTTSQAAWAQQCIAEADLDALFAAANAGLFEDASDTFEDEGDTASSPELLAVTHRIAATYVDVLVASASRILRGESVDEAITAIFSSVGDLGRLAVAADDTRQLEMLEQLEEALETYRDRRTRDRGHAGFRDFLRDWLVRFATHVEGEAATRVRELVDFDLDQVPVFRDLLELRGMGRRRLARLYAAGLYTCEALRSADPEDMAMVTGLPRQLAAEVVSYAQEHAQRQHELAILDLPGHLDRFAEALDVLPPQQRARLHRAATRSLERMRALVGQLERALSA